MTSDLVFVVVVLIGGLLSFLLLKTFLLRDSLSFRRPSLLCLFIGAYLFIMSFPSAVWFLSSTDPIRYSSFLAVESVPILLVVGAVFANAASERPSLSVIGFFASKITKTTRDSIIFPLYVLMMLSSVVIIAVYLRVADFVPLIGSLTQYG